MKIALLSVVLLAGCATDMAVTAAPESPRGECIRRTGSNVCANYRDSAELLKDATAADLEEIRRTPPSMNLPR
jgi:cytochrome c556